MTTKMEIILNSIKLPKIIIDQKYPIKYLKDQEHKRFNFCLLKYAFNRNIATVIFFTEFLDNSSKFVFYMTEFTRENLIVLITENVNETSEILEKFHKNKYLNVIFVDVKSFEESLKFQTFLFFKKYDLFTTSSFIFENESNLKGKEIAFLCLDSWYSFCERRGNKVCGFGSNFNIVYNFGRFINAEFKLELEKDIDNYDIYTEIKSVPVAVYLKSYPISTEIFSIPVDDIIYRIAMPKATPINSSLYIFRPMTFKVWIVCIVFSICSDFLLYITFRIIQKRESFWVLSAQIFRAMLGQSFPWEKDGVVYSTIQLLIINYWFHTNIMVFIDFGKLHYNQSV